MPTSPRARGTSGSAPGRVRRASRSPHVPRSSAPWPIRRGVSAHRSRAPPTPPRTPRSTSRVQLTGAGITCGRMRWSCGSKARAASTTARAGLARSPPRRVGSRRARGRSRACNPEQSLAARVWRNIRILVLLLVLLAVALQQWLDRVHTQSWQQTLWVGIYPLNADGSRAAHDYIEALTVRDFEPIEAFLAREAHRYGVQLDDPVHIELY